MKKKIVSVMLCMAMVLGGTACGNGNSEENQKDNASASSSEADSASKSSEAADDSSASGGDVVIKVFSNLPDRTSGQGLIEQMLFDQYMDENPNVDIQVEALDDESYKTKFKAYASGSSMPDLVNVWGQPSFLDEVIDAGLLAELDMSDYDTYGFLEGSLEGFMKGDKLYGLARNTDVMGFYYNKAIFEECNISIPETYDDFLASVAVLKDAGYIPVAFDGSDKWPMSIYMNDLYQKINGGSCHAEVLEAVKTGDYSNEAWAKAVDLTLQAVEAGAFQSGYETTDYGTSLNLFSNGQAAMYYMGSWEMSIATNEDISEEVRNNIGAFCMPVVEGGKGVATDITAWNGGGYAVTENSAVKEEAIKLLNYMFEPDHWSKLCWENGVCMSAQNFTDYLTGNETSLQLEWVELLNNSTSITGVTFNDLGTNEYKTISEDASIEVTIGSLTPDEFFDRLASVVK